MTTIRAREGPDPGVQVNARVKGLEARLQGGDGHDKGPGGERGPEEPPHLDLNVRGHEPVKHVVEDHHVTGLDGLRQTARNRKKSPYCRRRKPRCRSPPAQNNSICPPPYQHHAGGCSRKSAPESKLHCVLLVYVSQHKRP